MRFPGAWLGGFRAVLLRATRRGNDELGLARLGMGFPSVVGKERSLSGSVKTAGNGEPRLDESTDSPSHAPLDRTLQRILFKFYTYVHIQMYVCMRVWLYA